VGKSVVVTGGFLLIAFAGFYTRIPILIMLNGAKYAMGAAKKAAASIDVYLRGKKITISNR
jgi:hypothetical protein